MNERAILLWVWIIGYVICIALLMLMFVMQLSVLGNLPSHFSLLSSIYAPYIGTIFAYWFSRRGAAPTTTNHRQPFLVAVAMSALFQVLVIAILMSAFFHAERKAIESALRVASEVATAIAVLTAVPIGYFFGKERS